MPVNKKNPITEISEKIYYILGQIKLKVMEIKNFKVLNTMEPSRHKRAL